MTDSNDSIESADQLTADASTPRGGGLHRVLLVLIILGCAGVTSLVVLNVLGNRDDGPAKDLQGKALTPSLFDQPLATAPFTLTGIDGQPFGSSQLEGKVYVANFFFSTCPTMCPRILAHTRELQTALREQLGVGIKRVQLVSISVDPEKDTPAKLRETGELWDADPSLWRFLTGTRDEVWQVIGKTFRQPVSANPDNNAEPIIHSPKYVLIDRKGRIRGFYDGLKAEERSELLRDLLRLLKPAD